jgi:hypothetical protein
MARFLLVFCLFFGCSQVLFSEENFTILNGLVGIKKMELVWNSHLLGIVKSSERVLSKSGASEIGLRVFSDKQVFGKDVNLFLAYHPIDLIYSDEVDQAYGILEYVKISGEVEVYQFGNMQLYGGAGVSLQKLSWVNLNGTSADLPTKGLGLLMSLRGDISVFEKWTVGPQAFLGFGQISQYSLALGANFIF